MPTVIPDLYDLLKDLPPGAWAAVSEAKHKVLAYGADLSTVMAEAESEGEELPLMVKVPAQNQVLFL